MKLEVRDLKRHFGSVRAVDGISFTLERHEIYGFVGPNGAGKTTTMRILATLDEPDAGDVLLDGLSIVEHPEAGRRAIGYMPDSLPTHQDITVHEYLDFFARAYGVRGKERHEVVAGVEDFTGLGTLRNRFLRGLSKGMKQRVSLARAMVHDPQILVLDEPAAGLDPRARVELRELLLALAERGKTVLISSHILAELSEICRGAVIIESGRIVHAGTVDDLLDADAAPHWTFRVRALVPLADLHREVLTAPHIVEARPVGEELEVDVTGGAEAVAEFLRHLVLAHPVVEFRRLKGDLEDVFLQVTRGEVG